MSSPASEFDELPVAGSKGSADSVSTDDADGASIENSTLREIAEQLESDPQECWQALEGLASVELEVRALDHRRAISSSSEAGRCYVAAAPVHGTRPSDPTAARIALPQAGRQACGDRRNRPAGADDFGEHGGRRTRADCARGGGERSEDVRLAAERTGGRFARCLVAPVDGWGRSSIVISVNQMAQRRTAAFLCDVKRGIRDVVGEVEPESPWAGGLLDDVNNQTGLTAPVTSRSWLSDCSRGA